ncbi:MAG: phosphoribosylformylglycinamidine synthase subunit PurQ [Nitrosopumilus sp. B06]|nr:MAG: phosphoribosylformylglycinamidine synthase subunit PurQ [Nitrosopumilus sp. D6]RNJ78682.1 MAG: phosphoribosylformylglycinamidine synthase subunit PurQ [Nitrosopumilus sp. B06]
MRVGIVVFPGSNCDRDMYHVLADVFGLEVTYCWHEHNLPDDLDGIVLPGGFSYGDRLRAGAIAARSPVIADVKKMAQRSVPILGVCNGFQILVEAGLLPGALLKNDSLSFMCGWTELIVNSSRTPFTSKFSKGQRVPIPVANSEGRYYADADTLKEMERNDQIVFRYGDHVNGSSDKIAGVCNVEGNVVGMMPHPERAAEPEINPAGTGTTSLIFESLCGVAS